MTLKQTKTVSKDSKLPDHTTNTVIEKTTKYSE